MNVSQLVQLYAPLAGLLGVVFWLGMLTQQVRDIKGDVEALKNSHDAGGNTDRLIRLEVKMEHVEEGIASVSRGIEGVQRQLGNLMTRGVKGITQFPQAGET